MWSEHHQFLVGPANDGHYSYVTFVCAVQVISYLTDCVAVNSPELCAVCPFHGNRHINCVYGYVYVYMREMRPQIGGNHGDLLSCIPCDTRLPPTIDVNLCWWLQYCPKHLSLDANVAVLVDRQQQRQICTLNLHTPQLEICTSKTETSAESVLSSANAQTKSITNYQIQMSCDIGHLNGVCRSFRPYLLAPDCERQKRNFSLKLSYTSNVVSVWAPTRPQSQPPPMPLFTTSAFILSDAHVKIGKFDLQCDVRSNKRKKK